MILLDNQLVNKLPIEPHEVTEDRESNQLDGQVLSDAMHFINAFHPPYNDRPIESIPIEKCDKFYPLKLLYSIDSCRYLRNIFLFFQMYANF